MRIAILGYSGSGKSTLARTLGERYGLPVLHLDAVQFTANWQIRDRDEAEETVRSFLECNQDGWVIDGTYAKFSLEERLATADRIVLMLLPRVSCYLRCRRRAKEYCGRSRPDMAEGCNEKFDRAFRRWILWTGRSGKRSALMRRVAKQYRSKVVILRSQRAIDRYLRELP